jgi:hypothetical protein
MKKIMKWHVVFSITDTISFLNVVTIFYSLLKNSVFNFELMNQSIWIYLVMLFQFLLYFSLPISAYLHYKLRKSALIIYYIQFVFRLFFFSLSFGFILRINMLFNNPTLYKILAVIVLMLEITRFILSIKLHKKWEKLNA